MGSLRLENRRKTSPEEGEDHDYTFSALLGE